MAAKRICSVEGCGKPCNARGWCQMHYLRWRNHGRPDVTNKTPHGVPLDWLRKHSTHDSDQCLLWPFGKNGGTYGRLRFDGRSQFAHRVMCHEVHGAPATPEHEVAHSCGNKQCVNPRHLRWATVAENQADRIDHGTSNRGIRHGMAKLTEDNVRDIRSLDGSMSRQKIADQFGVNEATVRDIIKGKIWSWLK